MNFKDFYLMNKDRVNESLVRKVRNTSGKDLEKSSDEVFSISDLSKLKECVYDFIKMYKDWFTPIKVGKIQKMSKLEMDIDFDTVYYSDLKGELSEENGIPSFYKFFRYLDMVFLVALRIDVNIWNPGKIVEIYLEIASLDKEKVSLYFSPVSVFDKIWFGVQRDSDGIDNFFYSTHHDFNSCYSCINFEVVRKITEVIGKMKNNMGDLIDFLPNNDKFVFDMYWNNKLYHPNVKKILSQGLFARPMMKWIKM